MRKENYSISVSLSSLMIKSEPIREQISLELWRRLQFLWQRHLGDNCLGDIADHIMDQTMDSND